MIRCPREIAINAFHRKGNDQTDLESAEDHGRGPVFHEIGKGGAVGKDVILGLRLRESCLPSNTGP